MPHTGEAFHAIEKNFSSFKKLGINSMLYVGWRHDTRPWWYTDFAKSLNARYVSVLEAFGPNVADLKREVDAGKYDVVVHQGDIRKFDELFPNGREEKFFDLIFWDHGPEHVNLDELRQVTDVLAQHAGKIVLYAAPWGSWPQGADGGNQLEIHQVDLMPEHLESLGMVVKSYGGPGQGNVGELISWKLVVPGDLGGEW